MFSLFVPGEVGTMLRRKPTRLELKIDDTEEFESIKKELEVSVTQVQVGNLLIDQWTTLPHWRIKC